jgi:hypothetical protein
LEAPSGKRPIHFKDNQSAVKKKAAVARLRGGVKKRQFLLATRIGFGRNSS